MNDRGPDGKFLEGRKETPEEKLKRIGALTAARRCSPDYIANLKAKCPRLYNVWRAFMFTEKGKAAGHSEEWGSFKTFFNDVFPSYIEGASFHRKDTTKPFSKENFMWVHSKQLSYIRSSTELTYKGETHTLKDWAEILGCSFNGIRQRYYKGKNYTVEEILFGKERKNSRIIKDIATISEEQKRKDKISKMLSAYKNRDKQKGLNTTITKEYLEEIVYNGRCIYCGDTHNIGLDRVDNTKGHEIGNVVPCCYECNVARSNNFSHEEMFLIGKTIGEVKLNRIKNETQSSENKE